jgi:hypothetical protein
LDIAHDGKGMINLLPATSEWSDENLGKPPLEKKTKRGGKELKLKE